MSIRHVRAAQQYASTTEPAGRAVLAAIMQDVGWQGQPAHPTRETLAARTGYHPNSISNWIKKLAGAGDLILLEVGRHYEYLPPAAWDCDNQNENVTSEPELSQTEAELSHSECDNRFVTIASQLSQIEARLSQIEQRLSQIQPELSHPECELRIEEIKENNIYIPPIPPKTEPEPASLTEQALTVFCQATGIDAPRHKRRDVWANNWIHPLNSLLSMAGDSMPALASLIQQTAAYMGERGLIIATPASLVNIARGKPWEQGNGSRGKSSSNGHYPKPTPEPLPEEDWSTAPPPPTW